MKQYFTDETYNTPPETKRSFFDRLLFNGRWVLYAKFARIVLKSKKLAQEGGYDDAAWAESSYATLKAVESCGGRIQVDGLDTVRKLKKPVVFVANHMSTLETLLLPVMIVQFLRVTYVVKEKLVQGKAFGPIMRSRDPITVTRTNPRRDLQAVMSKGKELLENGCSVIIFPQSTRREVFRRSEFNTMGVKLALHANADIVPVALKTDFWTNGKLLKGFGPLVRSRKIHMAFGEAKSVHGRGKNGHAYTIDFIETHLKKWGANVEAIDQGD